MSDERQNDAETRERRFDAKTRAFAAISTLGLLGKRLPAPGTWGALVGMIFYWFAFQATGINTAGTWLEFAIWALLLVVIAVPVCEAGEKVLGRTDPGEVNFDEFAVMPICYAGLGETISASENSLYWLLAGFVLFRLFDIFKPLGISKLQKLKGGWGIVADDFAAAILVCICLWIAHLGIEKFL